MNKIITIFICVLILSACSSTNNSEVQVDSQNNEQKTLDDYIPENQSRNKNKETTKADSKVRSIDISAERFEFTPSIIRVKKGEKIKFNVENLDTTHDFFIPTLNVSSDEIITFDETGEHSFTCANFCGEGHFTMGGTIIVEE